MIRRILAAIACMLGNHSWERYNSYSGKVYRLCLKCGKSEELRREK